MFMLALYLAPLYILACIYAVRWLILWLGACHGILKHCGVRAAVIMVFALLALALPVGFLLPAWERKTAGQSDWLLLAGRFGLY